MKAKNRNAILLFITMFFLVSVPSAYSQIHPNVTDNHLLGGPGNNENNGTDPECDPDDEDFIILCKGGGNVYDSLECIGADDQTFDFAVFVRLNNLDRNPLPCDLVIGVELIIGGTGSLMIYSDPLVFSCSPSEVCGCNNITSCIAESNFNIPAGFFDSVCNGIDGDLFADISVSIYNMCGPLNSPVYSPFIAVHSDCTGWLPDCMNIFNAGVFELTGCISCGETVTQGYTNNGMLETNAFDLKFKESMETSKNESLFEDLALYPNPASTELSIYGHSNSTIIISSVLGMDGREYGLNHYSTNSYNISQLPNGLYIAVLQTENGMVLKRFMKN